MTGPFVVVEVRALNLQDELTWYVEALRAGKFVPAFVGNAHWAAQRLRSSCERNLGTRRRTADRPLTRQQRELMSLASSILDRAEEECRDRGGARFTRAEAEVLLDAIAIRDEHTTERGTS